MKFYLHIILIISTLLFASCMSQITNLNGFFPDSPMYNQEFRTQIDNSTIRVLAFNQPNISLGRYSDLTGALLNSTFPYSSATGNTDTQKISNPNSVNFQWYSVTSSIETNVELDLGSTNSKSKLIISKHKVVLEWSRFYTESLTTYPQNNTPLVSSIDKGVAVRLIFDVMLSSQNASLHASFGAGNLATQIALGNAVVSVKYNIKGTKKDILPVSTPTINSVDQFVAIQKEMYDAVRAISVEWDTYLNQSTQPSTTTINTIEPAVVAYYISGLPNYNTKNHIDYAAGYVSGMRYIESGKKLSKALEKEKSKTSDFKTGVIRAYSDVIHSDKLLDEEITISHKEYAKEALSNI